MTNLKQLQEKNIKQAIQEAVKKSMLKQKSSKTKTFGLKELAAVRKELDTMKQLKEKLSHNPSLRTKKQSKILEELDKTIPAVERKLNLDEAGLKNGYKPSKKLIQSKVKVKMIEGMKVTKDSNGFRTFSVPKDSAKKIEQAATNRRIKNHKLKEDSKFSMIEAKINNSKVTLIA